MLFREKGNSKFVIVSIHTTMAVLIPETVNLPFSNDSELRLDRLNICRN